MSKITSLRLPVETVMVNQKILDLRCEVVGHELFDPFSNPLVDRLRDLSLHPYSPDELRRIRDLGSRLSNDANQLLQATTRANGETECGADLSSFQWHQAGANTCATFVWVSMPASNTTMARDAQRSETAEGSPERVLGQAWIARL